MSEPSAAPAINEEKMNAFMGKVVGDFGASLSIILSYIGTKLGLYEALGGSNGMTSAELAAKTGTNERYIREWLVNQASGDYVQYDPASGKYSLLPEQKVALTDETSPFYVAGGFYSMKALLNAQPRIMDAFKNGGGILWGEHDPDLFVGTEKFFRPGYTGFLTTSWIPAISGVEEKLKAGGTVADVGCGHGASTIIMAKAYPNSRFQGFDSHAASIETATKRAADAGVSDRVSFSVCNASEIPAENFDLVTFFDCLHDMGDPHAAAKRAFEVLAPDGRCMIVEPMAGETVEENLNPIGRTFSGASALCCTANSLAQGGPALGAIASDSALREVVRSGGFGYFERATETPFNRIFEARR
jgi:2-polyprenyl-3-methyl-5-hydroxy-6-metoxy-1,4-benzoquinol methylase